MNSVCVNGVQISAKYRFGDEAHTVEIACKDAIKDAMAQMILPFGSKEAADRYIEELDNEALAIYHFFKGGSL